MYLLLEKGTNRVDYRLAAYRNRNYFVKWNTTGLRHCSAYWCEQRVGGLSCVLSHTAGLSVTPWRPVTCPAQRGLIHCM